MASVSTESQLGQIKTDIKERKLAPVYLLKGEEPYYIELICSEFEKNLIDDSARDFNMTVIYGKDANAAQVISLCRQYPLMSDKKLVILKESQLMEKRELEKLLIYFQQPMPSTVLVICHKTKTFDVKCKNAVVKSGGVVVESEKIKDYKLPAWISSYVKKIGFTIDEACCAMLCDFLGNNLQKISNEINKMTLNIKDRKNITKDDINEFIGISKDYNVFELQKALSVKDVVKVTEIVNYFEQNPKENPIQLIIPVLFSYFTKLLIASQAGSRNYNDIAAALGFTSSFVAKDYVTSLNYYNTEQLLNIISLFNEYDLKSKGIGASYLMSDADIMRELFFKIMHV